MRTIAFICGLTIAATGGAIAYRALFVEPRATIVITSTDTHEAPDMLRLAGGVILLIFGALLAFLAARRKRS